MSEPQIEELPLLERTLNRIDVIHDEDPRAEWHRGSKYPKELLYARRLTSWLTMLVKDPSDELRIAIRAQHLRRWKLGRAEFPLNKKGYKAWRKEQQKRHADLCGELMKRLGWKKKEIDRVKALIQKKKLATDAEAQSVEDCACLDFLMYDLPEFHKKHGDKKIKDILKKTAAKMSLQARECALGIRHTGDLQPLVAAVLALPPPK
jgi:hypothetical protein